MLVYYVCIDVNKEKKKNRKKKLEKMNETITKNFAVSYRYNKNSWFLTAKNEDKVKHGTGISIGDNPVNGIILLCSEVAGRGPQRLWNFINSVNSK